VRFCDQHKLVLIADEVYQVCVGGGGGGRCWVPCRPRGVRGRKETVAGAACRAVLPAARRGPSPIRTLTPAHLHAHLPNTPLPPPRQANIYAPNRSFHSFKKVVRQLQAPCPLVSLHSTSKGFVGECGRRGGYMEVVNFPPEIHEQVGTSPAPRGAGAAAGRVRCLRLPLLQPPALALLLLTARPPSERLSHHSRSTPSRTPTPTPTPHPTPRS
jgi:hypothetical protein